ncbi:glycosyltransferase family 4 protein [Conexibacter arvalis]|uniref:Glycosyltransferase involved in cell wall biosynthesis n=1 Tax=Conexibacter arvalis TaxID=912552 RepID=A0A840IC50_9ACTN|nr:glycosyltransferase family 4 protein [Conexibacter arvalis]MBB4661674.1 glycosyltransferase involved in cell wall biosynthesis [Conexibacter arvalis]
MRLAVYTDYTYRRDTRGVSGERAFVRFMTGLQPHVEALVLVGRLDARPGRSHYPLDPGIGFVGLPFYASLTDPLAVARSLGGSARRFWRLLDDVDTVWLLGPYVHAIGFALLAAARRRRVVLGVRQDFPTYVRSRHPGKRWIHVAADAMEAAFRGLARRFPVVVVGPDLARRYRRAGSVLEIAVSLVPGASVVSADAALARAQEPPRRLLSVGRLDREKNPLLLLDAIAALHAADPAWRLTVVGDGPMRGELEREIAARGLGQAVDLRGYVPHDGGLPELYRAADAFLHVSWTEGVPQVLFEAFAAGLPVVATAVGGVPEAVGDAALLIAPGDAGAAVAAVERVAGDPALRARLVRAGLDRVAAHTLEAETERLAGFLERG